MGKLDSEWAIQEIDAFLRVTAQVNPNQAGSGFVYLGTAMRGPRQEADARAHVIEQILDRTLVKWRVGQPVKDKDYSWLRGQASRAKAALERADELAAHLGDVAGKLVT